MKWWQHAIFSTFLSSIYIVLIMWLEIPEIGPLDIVALFSYSLPDTDARSVRRDYNRKMRPPSKHRHWFWHSSIIPLVVFLVALYANNYAGVGVFSVSIASHLLGDMKPGKRGKTGTYLIFVRKGDRMSRKATDAYLLLNSLACIFVAIACLFL